MQITNYKKHSKDKLLKKLKRVTLLNHVGKPVYVYKKAKIELQRVRIKDLLSFQLYKLDSSSKLVSSLYITFQKKYKEDILNMKGYATYKSNGKHYAFIPPIIECIKNLKGKTQKIIIDGLHRILLAKKLGKKVVSVAVIENVPQNLAVPAEPNKWQEVKLVENAPEGKDKRKWLVPVGEGYRYYRNFQSVFENIGKPRTSKS